MKKSTSLILFSLLLIFNSCKQQTNNLLDFSKIQHRFKYENLQSFSMDSLDWSQRGNFYSAVDSISFKQIMQDPAERYFYQQGDLIDGDFFYSKQKSPRGLIEFTVLSQREGSYIASINYKIYDAKGKLLSSFIVASNGGDAGYYEIASGKFTDEHTYELIMEDNYETKNPEDVNLIRETKIVTVINKDGSIMQSQKKMSIQEDKTPSPHSLNVETNSDSLNSPIFEKENNNPKP